MRYLIVFSELRVGVELSWISQERGLLNSLDFIYSIRIIVSCFQHSDEEFFGVDFGGWVCVELL